MKILLASLMCLVLCTSECFALKGGPVYPAGNNIVGTYAGVLQGAFDPTNPASSNTIGIFTLGVPQSGNANGSFVMFSRGRVFTGTARAFGDPEAATLKGILEASFNYTLSFIDDSGMLQSIEVTASANGPINADIDTSRSSASFSGSVTILRGEATLFISQGQVADNGDPVIESVLSLTVMGVKQSDTATITGTTPQ